MPELAADRLRPTIHPTYARLLCAYLYRAGFDNATIFRGTQLTWTSLLTEHRYLSLELFSRLVRRTVHLTGKPWIGLEIGAATAASAHGPLGYAAVSAPDLRAVLDVFSRYAGLRFQVIAVSIEHGSSSCELRMHERVALGDAREFVLASSLATCFQLLDMVTSQRFRDVRVHMPLARPPWHGEYERRLGVAVEFDAHALSMTLPESFLDTPCLTADPETYRSALNHCETLLKPHSDDRALSQRVMNRLQNCAGAFPPLDALANELAMSRRTLIRRLKAEGAGYQALLDAVRQQRATYYLLETDLSIERIAEQLGYRDSSNFSRTFRRWFGTTPRAMRKQARRR